jgi:RimJ/RimL family protein N-acetyltransferase
MLLRLSQVPVADLSVLVLSQTPISLVLRSLKGSMPPQFVAKRSLDHLRAGKPEFWSSPYYMMRSPDEVVVGSCGFKDVPKNGRVEIGYGVSPDARNQGLATAAVAELLRIALSTGEVFQVLAQIDPENPASTRVVERLGFASRGLQPDHDGEMLVQWIYEPVV